MKLYPTLVIRGTGLYELWKTGRYKSYPPSTLVDLVARILALVPPWTRVYRVQRHNGLFSHDAMLMLNQREMLTHTGEGGSYPAYGMVYGPGTDTGDRGITPRCAPATQRAFMVAFVTFIPIELVRRDYVANGGWETFLSYEDPEQDILVGLLRLRKCSEESFRPELKGGVSIGFGMLLMEEAERIAKEEHGSWKIAVISADLLPILIKVVFNIS
ncbi:hypothetical protein llap_15352 [Limosa lapponica baueri]|uniref:Radical SAM C-terminal extension domain-containing protein n=1 Tax=Limosa lapponica baueri TaxID=1758121 RepID=A0A2I0TKJ6_LIMLA|nr:hypothetical protein llap_15352 [Limosa lapponica baueri]